MKLLIFYVTFICMAAGLAQTPCQITGIVSDRRTQAPVAGAHVTLAGSGQGSVTDESGIFSFTNLLTGRYDIQISHIGYIKKTIPRVTVSAGETTKLRVGLDPAVLSLQGVTLTASGAETAWIPGNIHISRKEIERSSRSTLSGLLREIPGIELDGSSRGSSRISIRGSQANQVLVLIDGVPLNNLHDGNADISLIPLGVIESIALIKGGRSASYGSGAVGGVIAITTRDPDNSGLTGKMQYGSYGDYLISPSWSRKSGRLSLFASLQQRINQNTYPFSYAAPGDTIIKETRRNADFSFSSVYGKSVYRYGAHEFSLQTSILYSDRGLPGQIFTWTPYARVYTDRWRTSASWSLQRPGFSFRFHAGLSREHHHQKNIHPSGAALRDTRYPEFNYNNSQKMFRLHAGIKKQWFSWLSSSCFWELKQLGFTDRNRLQPNAGVGRADDLVLAGSLQKIIHFSLPAFKSELHIQPSLRYDRLISRAGPAERNESRTSPGISARLSSTCTPRVYLGFTKTLNFRAPAFFDLFYQDFRASGNADLRAEKNDHTEFTAGLVTDLLGTVRGECTVFSDRYTDLITWRLGSFEVFRPFNVDAAISGREMMLEWESSSQLILFRTSYSELDPRNRSGHRTVHNKYLPYRPLRSFTASLRTRFAGFSLEFLHLYTGKRYLNESNTTFSSPSEVTDITVSRALTFGSRKVDIYFLVQNIFDNRYEIFERMPLPGRRLCLGMQLK